jgi:hypothetical protein
MKNKLWIFGDSFSTIWTRMGGLGDRYREYKGYTPKIFSHYLSTMLDMDVEQRGKGGSDNFTIFDTIIHNLNDNNISTGDIVIIGWSSPTRFRLEKNNGWITIHNPGGNLPINLIESYKFMDINTLEQIIVNRTHSLYWDEVINWSRLLKIAFELKGIKVLFWSPFVLGTDKNLKKQLLPDDWYIGTDIDRLYNETNRIIDDSHFSETGHKKLADILYQKIVSK